MAPDQGISAALGLPRPRDLRRQLMKDLEVLPDQDEELGIPLPRANNAQVYARAHTDALISRLIHKPALVEKLYRRLVLHEQFPLTERGKIDRTMIHAQEETEAAFIMDIPLSSQGRDPSESEFSATSEPISIGDTAGKLFVSNYNFHVTFSLFLGVHTPSTTRTTDVVVDVYDALRSLFAGKDSEDFIQLTRPIGAVRNRAPYKWSIVRDYNIRLDPDDNEYVQVAQSPKLRKTKFAGFKFISPLMTMRHRKMVVEEINRFFITLRAAQKKLVILGSDTCYFHIHIRALSSGNVGLAIRFTCMYMLLEQLISKFIPQRKWADPMLCASMLEAHGSQRLLLREHIANSTQLIERFFACKSVAEVANLFNPAHPGNVYQTPLPESVRPQVRGTVHVKGPGAENYSFSKYYKVNLGYAFFNYGTLEFREHPAGLTEEDTFRWIDLCLRLISAASKLNKADLFNIARIKDLSVGDTKSDDYMFLAFCSILSSKKFVLGREEFDALLGSCWHWYNRLQMEEKNRWDADMDDIVKITPSLKSEEDLVVEIEERLARRQVYVHPKAAIEQTLLVSYKVFLPLLISQIAKQKIKKIDK